MWRRAQRVNNVGPTGTGENDIASDYFATKHQFVAGEPWCNARQKRCVLSICTSLQTRPPMKLPRPICAPMSIVAVIIALPAFGTATWAQPATVPQPRIAIRAVTPPTATSPTFAAINGVREIGGGKVIVNDGSNRALTMFDATLQHATVLADATGAGALYPRFANLIPYSADSTLFYESDSRTLVVIDGQGKMGRVLSLPHPQDFNSLTSGGPVGTDNHGHLIYQGNRSLGIQPPCQTGVLPAARAAAPAPRNSVDVIRADFETRTVDTVGQARISVASIFPMTTTDANCKVTSAKMRVNPSIPPTDSWTVTSRGTIAIVRSHDYHIDWTNPDGTKRSTPKMAFDWRRLTDNDKQAKIDSAKRIIDSVTAIGGYRYKSCAGGRSTSFSVSPSRDATGGGGGGDRSGGGGGRSAGGTAVSATGGGGGGDGVTSGGDGRPSDCQTVTAAAEFVPLDSMADYISPIRDRAALADMDGNVWILPATSLSANGGLLYDVVNADGVITESVQLPGGRTIAGFGKGGVVYLSNGDSKTGYVIEKMKVMR